MADRVITVNTAGGGDYSSIASAITAQGDFVAGEDNIVFNCYGGLDAGRVNIAAGKFTTSSLHRVKIKSLTKSGGIRGAGYRIVGAWGGYSAGLYTNLQWVEFYDISTSNTSVDGYGVRLTANCTIDRCIIYDCDRHAVTTGTGGGLFYYMSCIALKCRYGISTSSGLLAGDNNYIYNCVSLDHTNQGIIVNNNAKVTIINCYSGGNTGADITTNAGSVYTITTTYTEDGSKLTPTLAYSTTAGVYFTNVTAGTENCHLNSSSSGLIGVGTDLRTDPIYPITVDFDAVIRPAIPTVGAFEYAGSNKSFMHYYTNLMQGNYE